MSDIVHIAIERLKTASEMILKYYKQPLVICISGGKDSSVITELARLTTTRKNWTGSCGRHTARKSMTGSSDFTNGMIALRSRTI